MMLITVVVGKGSSIDQIARHTSNQEGNMKWNSRKIHRDDRKHGLDEEMEKKGERSWEEAGWRTVVEERNGKRVESREQEGTR
jgi:hypothetical protein